MAAERVQGWPVAPYKGLGFYTAADTPLFAGRDDDIVRCASLLAEWRTRLLLLHGSTACGKSSFLRAGLIPHLERAGAGIAFARTGEADQAPVLFVRATAEPLAKLADAVYRFAAREVTLSTPAGPVPLRLFEALPGGMELTSSDFLRQCADQPEALLEVLEKLSRIIPETLVLILDQGEEVLTVDPTAEGERRRVLFFDFLSDFIQAQFDLKLLIALRTEYFGRVISRARRGFRGSGIAEYYLDELSDAQVTEAVLRPTAETPVGSLGAPRDLYRFTFAEGVVERIVYELGRAGGKLPALQTVCTTLYGMVLSRPEPRRITLDDLEEQGGVEGSIERFLDQQIFDLAMQAGLSPLDCQEEVVRWKEALHGLTRPQLDGTVTTDLKPEHALRTELKLKKSRLDFDSAAARLASDEVRLIRKVGVVDVNTRELFPCFGLGHDTLGLVLRKWKERYDRERDQAALELTGEDEDEEPERTGNDIALCLSGGGYRAMLFHVGALWRLNELGYLPLLARVCGVSAGAIVAGQLGLQWHELIWGGAQASFVKNVVAPLRSLAEMDLEGTWMLLLPGQSSANRLVEKLKNHLYGERTLQDLPEEPRIVISATNMQTGSLFRFSKPYAGDWQIGRIANPRISLATAVAASSTVLSPLILRLREEEWDSQGSSLREAPYRTHVRLMDGTIYDNLGLESAWKRHRTILISDGGGRSIAEPEPDLDLLRQTLRISSLQDNTLRSLRRRQVFSAFQKGERQGAYWRIGSDRDSSTDALPVPAEALTELAALPSRFTPLSQEIQERLINLGYAVCDAAMRKSLRKIEIPALFPYPGGLAAPADAGRQ